VLTYALKDPVSEKSVARGMLQQTDALRVKVRVGFSLLDMKRFAESRGHATAGYRNLGLYELLRLRSPIVPIDEYDDPYFVVVRGVREGRIELADPSFANRTMSCDRLPHAWWQAIGFIFVAL